MIDGIIKVKIYYFVETIGVFTLDESVPNVYLYNFLTYSLRLNKLIDSKSL